MISLNDRILYWELSVLHELYVFIPRPERVFMGM